MSENSIKKYSGKFCPRCKYELLLDFNNELRCDNVSCNIEKKNLNDSWEFFRELLKTVNSDDIKMGML